MLATITLPYDGHPRRIRVHRPLGTGGPSPLLVLFDGQNVFGDVGSYAGGWHADTTVDDLPSTVRRPIVVGIDHGGVARIRELWEQLDAFLAFVAHDVLPEVRARWETEPGATLGGSSMGGLAAFAGHLRRPATFGSALVMSPSLWVAGAAVHRELEGATIPAGSRLYLDVGRREGGQMAPLAERLAARLVARGYGSDTLLWHPDARGTHQERHWRRRLPKALRFVFRQTVRR